tara:strand:- start:2036 stop:2326 length:291 start_codon:yes stop_codon:yes gene_type:complete
MFSSAPCGSLQGIEAPLGIAHCPFHLLYGRVCRNRTHSVRFGVSLATLAYTLIYTAWQDSHPAPSLSNSRYALMHRQYLLATLSAFVNGVHHSLSK